jgi:tyrosinase
MGTRYLDLDPTVDRRIFIKGLGVISTGLVMATLGGCEALFDQIANRPVRRRLRTGSPEVDDVIVVYQDAVNQMRALPGTDPRSWDAQAAIHGTVTGGFNFCQHGTDHFFSWHRAYLLYFEQICQELTGEDSFGLPYWNWNQDPDMHPEFTDPASPLNHPRINTSVAGNNAFTDATLDTIFGDPNFYTFGSQIEGTPHNTTHVVVGGDMVTGGSPLDPVFWAHHCMVDYCWAKWNIELENDNTNDQAWLDTSWNHFVDGDGDPVEVSALATVLMPFLSYQYESSAIGSFAASATLTALELRTVEERVRKGADVRFEIKRTVPIANRARISVARSFSQATSVSAGDFAALIESNRATERVFARINYAMLPSRDDFFVRVFINLPEASAATPTDDPHYAGSFAFFGTHGQDHGAHAPKTECLVYVSDTLQRLRAMGALRDREPISVQLVAVPVTGRFERADMELTLEQIDLIVSPMQVRSDRG